MSTTAPLLIDLTGVARLAGVRRPVASMWRSRFAATNDPFPTAVDELGGRPRFDSAQVADWLARTAHGNNPEARADAAAAATPSEFSFADQEAVAELEALIALYAQRGSLDDLTAAGLRQAAAEADPGDASLRAELEAHADRGAPWLAYAELLIDAAYAPAAALALVQRRRSALLGAAGSAGPLADDAIALITAATLALVADAEADVTVTLDANDAELTATLATALGDQVGLSLPADVGARRARRRLLAAGHWLAEASQPPSTHSVVIARVPARNADRAATVLRAVDDVSLSLRERDAAIIVGPARVLVEALGPADERLRADVLRSGRVRGIARLGAGLIETASREPLALWMLGSPMGQVPIADRFTVVADLIDTSLTAGARADLVSDLVASMGSARAVRTHAFRFGRFARTATLIARGDALLASSSATSRRVGRQNPAELPALIDAAAEAVKADLEPVPLTAPSGPMQFRPAAPVADLIRDGHLRVVAGTRVAPGLLGSEGLVVVAASDLDTPAAIGRTRVDQLTFATQHPSATLTRPGDVVFRTSPTAEAWVDVDGSKVVAYPARVLRITNADPGGLVPELIAADIIGQPAGPGAWKRWMLRRVAPRAITPLRGALAEITARSEALRDRAARLDRYAELLAAGVVAGAVTLEPEPFTDTTAAVAASTP